MNQPGCVAAPPLEPMTSHAPSPSAKPPRTCVYSLPVFAPMVVSRTSGKPLIVGGSGPAFLRYRVICPAISGWRYLIRPHGVREPRVPRGVISSFLIGSAIDNKARRLPAAGIVGCGGDDRRVDRAPVDRAGDSRGRVVTDVRLYGRAARPDNLLAHGVAHREGDGRGGAGAAGAAKIFQLGRDDAW